MFLYSDVLTHSMALVSLYTHWKYLKLMFTGGVERDRWHEAGLRTLKSSHLPFSGLGVFKHFANCTRKNLCWSLFLIKLQPWRPDPFSKRDSNAGVFLWNCKIFRKSFFHRTPPVTTFGSLHIFSMNHFLADNSLFIRQLFLAGF